MIYVLLVGLALQLLYCYYVFNKDLFSPSAVLCEVFIISVLACLYNISGTGFDIQPTTVNVILGGNAVFILVSTFLHLLSKKNNKKKTREIDEELRFIEIDIAKMIILTVVYFVFSIVFVVMTMSIIGNLNNSGDFSVAMNAYRNEMSENGSGLPGWLTKIGVILNLGTFLLTYVFINNVLVDKRRKSNYLLLLCVCLYLISSIFTAQRTTILIMFIYTLFILYNLLNRKYHFIGKMNRKYARRGILFVVVFLMLFGLTRGIFGRQSKLSVIDNTMVYTGGSIEFLDDFIKNPTHSEQFGEELFYQFRSTLSDYGIVNKPTGGLFMEFRKAAGGYYGNIYTGYREYIHDFGYGSIVVFQVVLAIFFGYWYEKITGRSLKRNIDLSFVFFAWFVSCVLFRFSIMNAFFTDLSYFVFTHWYVFVAWKWLLNLKIVSGNATTPVLAKGTMVDGVKE